MNSVAIISCELESVYGIEIPAAMKIQAELFRKALHRNQPDLG
jgi:hypothetical protein